LAVPANARRSASHGLPLQRCIVFLPTTLAALVLSQQSVEIKRRFPVHDADEAVKESRWKIGATHAPQHC